MPNLPIEPVMISAPDQVLAAVENLLALDLVTPKQARVLRLLANQPDRIVVERVGCHALRVSAGDRRMRVMSTGAVRYL
jgi:hypothetical protein